jgi:hypothetical protein
LFVFLFCYQKKSNAPEEKPVSKSKKVTCRIVFLKMGQIDTKNERFDCEGIYST